MSCALIDVCLQYRDNSDWTAVAAQMVGHKTYKGGGCAYSHGINLKIHDVRYLWQLVKRSNHKLGAKAPVSFSAAIVGRVCDLIVSRLLL